MVLPLILADVSSNTSCVGISSWIHHWHEYSKYQGHSGSHGLPSLQPSLWRPCPETCPVQMHIPGQSCEFTCVNGSLGSCTNPAMNVADLERSKCRSCKISGCQVCSAVKNAPLAFPSVRMGGHAIASVYTILGLFFATLASWYLWLRRQPTVNPRVLKRAIMRRQHLNLRDHTTRQHLWYPLSTNLCRARSDGHIVGGRALLMFFSFQGFVLLWCSFATLFWILCAVISRSDMLNEGKVSAFNGDIFSICHAALNQQGTTRRDSAKLAKLAYTATLYIFTTLATFCYVQDSIRLDTDEATMKDFAVMLKGFPRETGKEVEGHRLACQPIGVSICWDYDNDEVTELLARETWLWGKARDSCRGDGDVQVVMPPDDPQPRVPDPFDCKASQARNLGKARRHEERATLVAANAASTSFMYAVFPSEGERDRVRQIFSSKSEIPLYHGHRIKFEASGGGSEPETVLFQNFGKGEKGVPHRAVASVCGITGAIVLWGLLFYFPFAIYEVQGMRKGNSLWHR
eukprot:symbB.v1.2.013615.t1/scaffold968.1/size148170/10